MTFFLIFTLQSRATSEVSLMALSLPCWVTQDLTNSKSFCQPKTHGQRPNYRLLVTLWKIHDKWKWQLSSTSWKKRKVKYWGGYRMHPAQCLSLTC